MTNNDLGKKSRRFCDMYVLSPDLALPEIIIILCRCLFTEKQGVPAVPGPGDYEVLVHVHGPHVVLVAPQGQHQLQTVPGTTSYSPYRCIYEKIFPRPEVAIICSM
jgi:hypothetical protein